MAPTYQVLTTSGPRGLVITPGGTNQFSIANFLGAHPNDPTFDVAPAYYAALAAAMQASTYPPLTGEVVGGVYFPAGNWYTSKPLIIPASFEIWGDGYSLTVINSGIGTTSTPNLVPGFAGPIFYSGALIANPATYTWTPTYNAGLHAGG